MSACNASEFFTERVLIDPFDFYDSVRGETPILPVSQPGKRDMFLITSYELIGAVLRDNKTFSSKFYDIMASGAGSNPEAEAIYANGWPEMDTLLTSDLPEHARYRTLTAEAFKPKRIAAMEPRIAEAIDLLVDRFIERGECDFIHEFAVPLPIYMISDVLGIDRSMLDTVHKWSDAYILRNGQMGSKDQEIEAARQIVECQHFLYDMIQVRRKTPMDDMVSDLVYAEIKDQEPLNDMEILSILQLLVVGGNETTRNTMIGMMARLLGSDRDQYEKLRQDPAGVRTAVEEALRLEGGAASTWRIALEDIELGGVSIPKGATVICKLDAANRDPAMFGCPAKLDLDRKNTRQHLAFGMGSHFCIGHVLARRELTMALARLLERLPDMTLIDEKCDLRIHPSVHIRGIRKLHIAFTPGTVLGQAKSQGE